MDDGPEATQPDHERIWLQPRPPFGVADDRTWCQHDVWTGEPDYEGDPPTEYVRADIAAAARTTDLPDFPKPDRLMSSVMSMAQEVVDRVEVLRAALESIAANACCDRCQEAALVARKALGDDQ